MVARPKGVLARAASAEITELTGKKAGVTSQRMHPTGSRLVRWAVAE